MEEHEIKALRGLAEWHQDPYWSAIARKAADTIERQAREIDAFKEKADYRGKSFAKAIQDYNEMRDQKNAALAEVERWKDWSGSLPSSWFARWGDRT